VVDFYIGLGQNHVHHNGWKIKHLRIIKDLKKFTSENRTLYDLAVASLLSLVAANRPVGEGKSYNDDGQNESALEVSGFG
jgi:hypothetical protein